MEQTVSRPRFPGSPELQAIVSEDVKMSWPQYRRQLQPRYARAWIEVAFCYLMLALAYAVTAMVDSGETITLQTLVVVPSAFFLGFWLHAIPLYGHEAAHFNMAADRRRNDRLADWFIWPLYPLSTESYRRFHWLHHTHLGDHQDTENSYQNCMSPWFLLRLVTCVHMMEKVREFAGRSPKQSPAAIRKDEDRGGIDGRALVRSSVVHALLVGLPAANGLWTTAGAWVLAVAVAYPLFNTVRQVLEHRREDATCDDDFSQVEHGPYVFHFGQDWFSRFYGAAGFNRHLFHHWDPSVSYTNFTEMEAFLRSAGLGSRIDKAQRAYGSAFVRALRSALRGQ